ncbi:MAG: hypothetical protein WCH84_02225 [Verrucomicrobiota bacterium]
MKIVVIVLAVALVVFGVLYFQSDQARIAQAKVLWSTQEQLTETSNQVVSVEVEMATIKKQMTAHVEELESSLTTLGNDKNKIEARAKELQGRIEIVEKELTDEKAKVKAVEDERTQVTGKLTAVSNQLVTVRSQLSDLQKRHAGTEAELSGLRAKEGALESERDSLERRLNDLDELHEQIRVVKRRQREEHIAEWKKRDTSAGITGNRGVLMKDGQWQR